MTPTRQPRSVAMILNSPGFGGVPLVVNALVSGLDRKRFTPHVYFLKGFTESSASECIEQRGLMSQAVTVGGATAAGGKVGAITHLTSWLKQHRIDILHTHSFRPNLYGRMAGALCRNNDLAIVSHYHNHYDDKWLSDPASLELERHLAPITDANIAVSDSVSRHVSARVGVDFRKISVIGNGVDIERFAKADPNIGRELLKVQRSEICIGLVGRVCHQKGVDLFVQAAIQVASQLPQARFVIVGDIESQTLYEQCQASIESAGLTECIRFVGHVDDAAPTIKALDVLVVPSRWEGFGLILVEAMAAGVPIIASRVGAIPEVTQRGRVAQLIPSEDADALATEMLTLASYDSMRDRLVRVGRQRAEDFSWQTSVDAISSVYDQIMTVDQ